MARTSVGVMGYEPPLSHNSRHHSEKGDTCGFSSMEPHTLAMVSDQLLNRQSGILAFYT